MKTIQRYINEVRPFRILFRTKLTGDPIEITLLTISIMVKKNIDDADGDAKYSNTNVPHIDEKGGIASTANVTFNWTEGQYFVQVKLLDSTGQIIQSAIGNLVLSKTEFKGS